MKQPDPDQTAGEILRAWRIRNEYTQTQIAQICDCTYQYIAQIESGKRLLSIEQAIHLADTLGLETDKLVTACFADQMQRVGMGDDYRVKLFRV